MADHEGPPLPPQPSLQELCETKVLGQILRSDDPDSDFASLDSHSQLLLFTRLRTENARLREGDGKWRLLTKYCPATDLQIYFSSTRIEPGSGEDEQNGYDQKGAFLDRWSYLTEDGYDNESEGDDHAGNDDASGPELVRDTTWDQYNLFSESPDSDLRLCFHDEWDSSTRCLCRQKGYHSFSTRVSSQLLLYRLTVTFGMPPSREDDGYKSCWVVDLRNLDGISVLSFQDYKGAADVRFYGTTEASVDALKLLNFLVGMECPHTYDGILAGTRA